MAICQPFIFRQTAVRARRSIIIVWIIAVSAATPDLISMELHYGRPEGPMCLPAWEVEVEQLHLLLQLIFFYLVPLIIMTFTYVKVALCLWRSGSSDENDEAAASVPRAQMQLRRKKAKMLIVVVAMFAICYLPVYTLFILWETGALAYIPVDAVQPLGMLSHWLCYFNSSINPVIYNFMSCNFRREFRVACYLCCRRGSSGRMSAYEAMRLRNITHMKHMQRHSQNETSGLTRTESTLLATPILNGRRGEGAGASTGASPDGVRRDSGRHLFINYQPSSLTSLTDKKVHLQRPHDDHHHHQHQQQQQQLSDSPTSSLRSGRD